MTNARECPGCNTRFKQVEAHQARQVAGTRCRLALENQNEILRCSDPTYSTSGHSYFWYISLLCTRYPPGLRYRPPHHGPILQTAPGLTFPTYSSTGITLPNLPSLQTLEPMAQHAPDTRADGLYSLPEPSNHCVLLYRHIRIDPRPFLAHVSRPRPFLSPRHLS